MTKNDQALNGITKEIAEIKQLRSEGGGGNEEWVFKANELESAIVDIKQRLVITENKASSAKRATEEVAL